MDYYNIYLDGSKDHQISADSTDTFVDQLASASTHDFYVTAVDTVGNESSSSNTVTVTTEDKTVADTQLPKVSSPPTIDATVEGVWNSVSAKTLDGSPSNSDLSATWKALWDDTNLYYLVEVTDDTLTNDSDSTFSDDAVEIYLDPDNSGGGTYDGSNDYQLVFGYNDSSVVTGANSVNDTTDITFATTVTDSGWRLEANIPWSTLGVTPSTGMVCGTDIHVIDDDSGSGRDAKISWNDPKDQAWRTPRLFGRAKLVEDTTDGSDMAVAEAEHNTDSAPGSNGASNSSWAQFSANSASGDAAMEATPNAGVNTGDSTDGPRLDYDFEFPSNGTYYIWVRGKAPDGESDSVHVGLDGNPATYGDIGLSVPRTGSWGWVDEAADSRVTVDVASADVHTVNLWMRQDGVKVDKILLTQDSSYTPSGTGPVETNPIDNP
jgi:hypothetical protein